MDRINVIRFFVMTRQQYFVTDKSSDSKIADEYFKNASQAQECGGMTPEIAISNLKQCLHYNRHHWPAMFNLGIRMHERGSLSNATRWFTRCSRIKSDFSPAYEYACLCNLKTGNIKEAKDVIEKSW